MVNKKINENNLTKNAIDFISYMIYTKLVGATWHKISCSALLLYTQILWLLIYSTTIEIIKLTGKHWVHLNHNVLHYSQTCCFILRLGAFKPDQTQLFTMKNWKQAFPQLWNKFFSFSYFLVSFQYKFLMWFNCNFSIYSNFEFSYC